jgi:hypothetical protein
MSQAAQLGQQGSDHGQYGQTPIVTPYGMDSSANANQQQNENTQNVGDYSPMLPSGGLMQGQPKQWYPGMYPSTSPQFGTNPYAPQTFNVQGHPGHNPSTFAAVEPNINNSAMSNQGQFVQRMARGGKSKPAPVNGGFTYTEPPKTWDGPVSTNSPNYQQQEQAMNAMFANKGLGQPQSQSNGMGMKGPSGGIFGDMAKNNPDFARALGLNNETTQQNTQPRAVVQQISPAPQVYAPQYAQYAPVRTNIDSYGNPLFNYGGSIKE